MQTYQAGKYNFRRISCVFAIFVVPSRGTDINYSMLALILQVGTCRALRSKCHPRHFFTSKVHSQNAGHTIARIF